MRTCLSMKCLPTAFFLAAACCGAPVQPVDTTPPRAAPTTENAKNTPTGVPANRAGDAQENGAYHLEDGPFAVGESASFKFHDAAREKTLDTTVRYPKPTSARPFSDDDRFPLIVFSHGMGGSKRAFENLSRHWASRGYVVIHPTHSDNLALQREIGADVRSFRDNPKSYLTKVDPKERVDDVKLILDSLDSVEKSIDLLRAPGGKGRIDRERIGMAGHSAGAFTTQIAFGAKVRGMRFGGGLKPTSFGDDRIKAAIVISGPGLNNLAFTKDSWSEISRPMMVITGSKDVTRASDETPETRQHPYDYARPGDKYLVFIEGATHSSYAGNRMATRLLGEPPAENIERIGAITSASTTAFWDSYLKQDEAAAKYLAGDSLVVFGEGSVTFKRK